MSTATSTFNDKATDDNFYTSKDGQSCVSLLSVVCGYPSVSPVRLNTENISKLAKMAAPLSQKSAFYCKSLKQAGARSHKHNEGKRCFPK